MPRTRSIAWSELKLGIVGLIAAALIVVIVVAIGGEGGFFWERYPLKARFLDAQGLRSGAIVRLSGKEVGRVKAVEFADGFIDVSFEVSKSLRPFITDTTVGKIGSSGLLGESLLDLKSTRGGTPVADWGYVRTGEAGTLADFTTTAADSLKEAGDLLADIRAGKGTVGKLVTDDAVYKQLQQFVGSAADLADRLKAGEGTVGRLVNDPAVWNSLKASLENLQAVTAQLKTTNGAIGRFLNDEATGKSLSNTLANLDQTTGRLNRGDGTIGKLLTERELYDRVNSMASRLDQVAAGLNTTEGTAGRLLHDQQLYESMNTAVTELRNLLSDIRKDPKKYLNVKVSIF
ncbi:MAG TPA: MlaD family protein [Vicinamibacterales bacterium]|nr:MlaD family protein [Vicinamibacterales bacterium]